MTDLHLPRLDLARAVTDALGRGRYVLMTGGDGQPLEITLDLKERPDDLFEAEHGGRRFTPEEVAKMFGADDHGPSVPAQDWAETSSPGRLNAAPAGPRVYEFALQDINESRWAAGLPRLTLDLVGLSEVNGERAAAADWVHVYDRVTRERRTLKRPEPDAVLTGLRDVAADLRRNVSPAVAAYASALRGAPVEPPFGCTAAEPTKFRPAETVVVMPPVGPLTSTEGLRAGDVLRAGFGIYRVCEDDPFPPTFPGEVRAEDGRGSIGIWPPREFAFVGRPDADGWMTWAGGENPVPGAVVEVRLADGHVLDGAPSGPFNWGHRYSPPAHGDIVAFRIVDTPPAV